MRIRQIVFAAQDLPAGREVLAALLQLPTPFRDPGVAEFGIDNAVFTFGDQFIEVIAPVQPDTACGRHLARFGDGGYMLILQTDDLAREHARIATVGVRSVWSKDLADISATHLHPKDVGGAIVSIDEPRPAASWRWGGPDWQVQEGAAGAQRIRGITLNARNPKALATRWAQVLDCLAPLEVDGRWRVALSEGFADFQQTANDADGVAGFTLAVAEPEAVLARARGIGLAVTGDTVLLLGAKINVDALPD